jgi:hypothetical protein
MKIHIFYSHYNVAGSDNKSRPVWFDYEQCFKNLLKTTHEKNIEIHVAMDGSIEDNWIAKYKDRYDYLEFKGGDTKSVTLGVYNFVKNYPIDNGDLIYILENDYLHVDNWVEKVNTLFSSFSGLTYVSLYDHNDKYFLPAYSELVSRIWATSDLHWRSTPSTCGSYITTKQIFDEDFEDHTGVTTPVGDHHKWLFLGSTKGRFLLTPMPGLSTHCMEGLMSPTIDWKSTIQCKL